MPVELINRDCWIFDLDGTLTVPIHNFEDIRKTIGIPSQTPILEYLSTLPKDRAVELEQELRLIELDLAHQAKAETDAISFLNQLFQLSYNLGVVTRNTSEIAAITLKETGLEKYFEKRCIFGRDNADPKPSPSGIHKLLTIWNTTPEHAVMVGDYLFDLQAGLAAGTKTIYLDRKGLSAWNDFADITVTNFNELTSEYLGNH